MPENVGGIIYTAVIILALVCICALVLRILRKPLQDRLAPVKTVKAQVVDKFVANGFSKIYSPIAKRPRYYVVFAVGNKKRSFSVSELSYGGYQLHERGTLKYKGCKLVDFHRVNMGEEE